MPKTSQHIPQTCTKIGLFPSLRDSQMSALSCSVRSTSHFAVSVPARIKCLAQVAAHHDMTACLCVSLFIGRGVLDEHACPCVAQCKSFRACAAPGSLQQVHAGLLSRRQEAGQDYGNEIDLRQIQYSRLHGDTGRGVLKRSSDYTAIIVVQTGSGQSEKRNTPHAQQQLHSTSWALCCRYRVVVRIPIPDRPG